MAPDKLATPARHGFLARLLRDQRGNTMAMMTAAVIPMIGLVGGAVDMSRMYLVKARMQQACDAGALAGRKRMAAGSWDQSNYAPRVAAETFFDSNFEDQSYGTTDRKRSFTENAGKVTGTAEVIVPMTLMKVFDMHEKTIGVECDAEMRIPNTDIMFVLDVTGSMAAQAGTQTRIQGLRSAVKCFYQVLAKYDSNEDCEGAEPSGGTGTATQIRFGFVPYATNVNVGRLLPTNYFADTWDYQSRRAETRPVVTEKQTTGTPAMTSDVTSAPAQWVENRSGNGSTPYNGRNYLDVKDVAGACNSVPATDPRITGSETIVTNSPSSSSSTSGDTTTTVTTYRTTQNDTEYDYEKVTLFGRCYTGYWRTRIHARTREYSRTDTTTRTTENVFVRWHYAKHAVPVSALKNGTSWNTSFEYPIGTTKVNSPTIANKTITWDGCIEERATVAQNAYSPIPAGARDLDIDAIPNSGTSGSLWGPALHGLTYLRGTWREDEDDNWYLDPSRDEERHAGDEEDINGRGDWGYQCPDEARRLQTWNDPTAFDAYVDGLDIGGNTYHDIGLLWGARFLSPTGLFAADNKQTPTGGQIERHLVFMTDGEACTSNLNYAAYGVEYYDRRRTTSDPTGGCNPNGTITAQVNARYAALCTEVKNKNITLWVVSFAVAKVHRAGLEACATPDRFYSANDATELRSAFTSIAAQISQLRLTS